MKKRFKLTIEIDTNSPDAEDWVSDKDYMDNVIDDVISQVSSNINTSKNYSYCGSGYRYSVSFRKISHFNLSHK